MIQKKNFPLWLLFICLFLVTSFACQDDEEDEDDDNAATSALSWQHDLDLQLSLSGHRNWILIVDKAFPEQPGMHIINTGEKLLPVLETTLKKINQSTHVRPVIYNDAELGFLTDSLAPGVNKYKDDLAKILGNNQAKPMLHDSVFVQMNAASKLFSVAVLKTEEIIPYSSVFIQLDCAYWGSEQEQKLRKLMSTTPTK